MTTILAGLILLAGDGLGVDEFRSIHEKLKPPTSEVWRSIPWKVSLVEAQQQAAKEKKPLFIWSMDGNPLGCG
jgi:hypothetical protein